MNSSLICVTQKSLVQDNFLNHLEKIIQTKPFALILREKELNFHEYANLTKNVALICQKFKVELFLNTNLDYCLKLAEKYNCSIQISFDNFVKRKSELKKIKIGISIHSLQEANHIAEQLNNAKNINHVLAGHIFETKCKEGLEPRGVNFLENVVNRLTIPVFGIGGITPENCPEIQNIGAGIALMSSLMTCQEPKELIASYTL